MCDLELPVRVISEANQRGHWAGGAERARSQRFLAALAVKAYLRNCRPLALPAVITLTRLAPRKLDSDNLARAFKAVRDGIADALGIEDGDERLEWRYAQHQREKGGTCPDVVNGYGIRIRIEAAP